MLLLALSFAWNSSAQAKQTRVQLEQIGALKIYIGYAKKGYSIVRQGLSTIGDLKQGDLNIHTGYFSSLSDDERLTAIDRIFADMQDKLLFLRSFNNSATVLSLQREKEANDVRSMRRMEKTVKLTTQFQFKLTTCFG